MYLRAVKLMAEAAWKEVDFSIFSHMETFIGGIPTGLTGGALSLAYADALEEAWGKLQAAGDTLRQAPPDAPMVLEVQGFEEWLRLRIRDAENMHLMITDVMKQVGGASPTKPGSQPLQTQVVREQCRWIVAPVRIGEHAEAFRRHCPGICPHHLCSRLGCTSSGCSRVHWGKNPDEKAKESLDALATAIGPEVKVTVR